MIRQLKLKINNLLDHTFNAKMEIYSMKKAF